MPVHLCDRLAEPPFRTKPRSASAGEVEERNAKEALSGSRSYEPSYQALSRLRVARSAVRSRLLSWALHPDERVPLALLERRKPLWESRDHALVEEVLLYRALGEANREGVVWTPLLDAFDSHPSLHWPWHYDEETYEHLEDGWDYFSSPELDPEQAPWMENRDSRLARLLPWIERQTAPRELDRLLEGFGSLALWETIALHARCLDTSSIQRLLQREEMAPRLAENPHLTPGQQEGLERWALSLMARHSTLRTLQQEIASPFGPRTAGRPALAERVLERLEERGHAASPAARRWLQQLVSPWNPTAEQERFSRSPADHESRTAAWNSLMALRPPLLEEELLSLYPKVRREPARVEQLLLHESAGVALWRMVLADSSLQRVREHLAEMPNARQDPMIRRRLLESNAAAVLAGLLKDAPPEEFPLLARKLLRHPELLLPLLNPEESRWREVSFDTLAPLFAASNPPVWTEALERVRHVCFREDREGAPLAGPTRFQKEYGAAFRALSRQAPSAAIAALRRLEAEALATLSPADLAPLLSSASQETRLSTIAALGGRGAQFTPPPRLAGRTRRAPPPTTLKSCPYKGMGHTLEE